MFGHGGPLARAGLRAGDIILSLMDEISSRQIRLIGWLERRQIASRSMWLFCGMASVERWKLNWDDDTFDAVDSVPRQAESSAVGPIRPLWESHSTCKSRIAQSYAKSIQTVLHKSSASVQGTTIVVISGHRITSPSK